ncbi:MAG: SBBP repeat-containing protein, partial [Thermoplasmatota archaeon]
IKLDASNNSYIAGYSASSDYPTTSGAYDQSNNGNYDVVVTKVNSTGQGLVYSTYIGGPVQDYGVAIELDSSTNAYVTGRTDYYWGGNSSSTGFPTTSGAYDRTMNGGNDVFVLKLNKAGSALLFSTFIGGSSTDNGEGISIDGKGNVYVTGLTRSSSYPTTWGCIDSSHNGVYDVFVSVLGNNGSRLYYSTFVGSSNDDGGRDIQYFTGDYVYVTGWSSYSGFPTTNGSYDRWGNGQDDVILFKMDFTLSAPPTAPRNLVGTLYPDHVQLDWTHPADNGTAPLLGYYIYRYSEGGNGSGNRSSVWFWRIATVGPVTTWRDNDIVIGNFYYYFIIAYNSVGPSPESNFANATDWTDPVMEEDYTLSYCYGGEPLDFTIEASDNVKIKSVRVFYQFSGDWIRSLDLIEGAGNTWTGSIDVSIGAPDELTYHVEIEDHYRNSVRTDDRRIAVMDGLPWFLSDSTPATATTGDPLMFTTEVLDNTAVQEVVLRYWYGEAPSEDARMVNTEGNTWALKVDIPNTLETLHYTLHAKDGSGYLNETLTQDITVIDDDLPEVMSDDTPLSATTGDEHVFLVKVSDNIAVSQVNLLSWYEGKGVDNRTMEEWTNGEWKETIILPSDDLSSLHYDIWVLDTSGNSIFSGERTIEVKDNDLPVLVGDRSQPTGYTGMSYDLVIEAKDNILVQQVWFEYWYGDGAPTNSSASGEDGEDWRLTITIPHSLDRLHYIVRICDPSGNWEAAVKRSVDIKDRQGPVFVEDRTPGTATNGGQFTFEVVVADNIETRSVAVEYWFGNGEHQNATISGSVNYQYTIDIPLDETEDLNYRFHSMDSSLNWNSTITRMVTVRDEDEPTISFDTTPETGTVGEKFTFSVFIDDNVGIESVSVEYWFDDGDHHNITLSGSNPYRTIIDLPAAGGKLYYRFHATDLSGNVIVSEISEVTVREKQSGGPSGADDDDEETTEDDIPAWVWIILGAMMVLVILTVLNFWASVMKRKGKEQQAPPGGQTGMPASYYDAPPRQQDPYPGYPGYPPPADDLTGPYDQDMYRQEAIEETAPDGSFSEDVPEQDTPGIEPSGVSGVTEDQLLKDQEAVTEQPPPATGEIVEQVPPEPDDAPESTGPVEGMDPPAPEEGP